MIGYTISTQLDPSHRLNSYQSVVPMPWMLSGINPPTSLKWKDLKPISSTLPQLPSAWRKAGKAAEHFGTAAALAIGGLLLHKLPVRTKPGVVHWLPTDWKIWARVFCGIKALQHVNKGLNWQPPPWLGALEAVALINPIAMGFARKNMLQMLVMGPLVAGVVQGSNELHKITAPRLKREYDVPSGVTRLGISLGMVAFSLKVYPHLLKAVATRGWLGQDMKTKALKSASLITGSAMVTCPRGCTPGGFICMSEMGEILGGMTNWFQSHWRGNSAPTTDSRHIYPLPPSRSFG